MEIYTDKYSCLDKTFHTKFTCIIYKAYIEFMIEGKFLMEKDYWLDSQRDYEQYAK